MGKIVLIIAFFLFLMQCAYSQENLNCKNRCQNKIETCRQNFECFFDSKFTELKQLLCLSAEQEYTLNCIYDRYKKQMQIFHIQAKKERLAICKEINNCGNKKVIKKHKKRLKDIEKDSKEQFKCMYKEFSKQLCKYQKKILKRFYKREKQRLKSTFECY